MSPFIRIFLFFMAVSYGFAQLDSNSLTVSATRSASLQADQAVFGIYVESDSTAGLNDVVAAVQGAGLTLANFLSVSSPQLIYAPPAGPQPQPRLQWTFGLPVPIAKTKDTVATLTTLQQSLAQDNAGMRLTFSVQGTQVSLPLQQSQSCSMADLITDARGQAQKLAAAAGLTLGSILAMSSNTASTSLGSSVYVGVPIGAFISSSPFTTPYPASCFLAVKFALK